MLARSFFSGILWMPGQSICKAALGIVYAFFLSPDVYSQEIINPDRYRIVAVRKNNPEKQVFLLPDRNVRVTLYERRVKTALDITTEIVSGYDPGFLEYRGKYTVLDDSAIRVDGREIQIREIKKIRAFSEKGPGKTVAGGVMLGTVPLWAVLAYPPFTWSGIEMVVGMFFISVPAITLAVTCAGFGLDYLAAKATGHTYRLNRNWELGIVRIPPPEPGSP